MSRRSIGTVRELSQAWGLDPKLARAQFMGEAFRDCLDSIVVLARRSVVTAGHALPFRQRIALHPALLQPGRECDRNATFLHECAHVLTDRDAGRRCNHGPSWYSTMAVLGEPAEVRHAYPYLSRANHAKWLWVCTSCGHEYPFVARPRRKIDDCHCHLCGLDRGRLACLAVRGR